MGWQSVMWEHPEHLEAIGMISIEINNVESFLADLLAEILEVLPNVGRAIYWRALNASLRIGIVKAAAETTFAVRYTELSDAPEIRKLEIEINAAQKENLDRALRLLRRAEKVSIARNDAMHNVWGTDNASGSVSRAKTGAKKGDHRIVPLEELHALIDRMRSIIDDTQAFSRDLLMAQVNQQMAAVNAKPAPPELVAIPTRAD